MKVGDCLNSELASSGHVENVLDGRNGKVVAVNLEADVGQTVVVGAIAADGSDGLNEIVDVLRGSDEGAGSERWRKLETQLEIIELESENKLLTRSKRLKDECVDK